MISDLDKGYIERKGERERGRVTYIFTHRDYCRQRHYRQRLNDDVHGQTVSFHTIDDASHRDVQ